MGTAVQLHKTRVWLSAGLVLVVLALAPGAARAVKCTTPDDLCTGDPCVIRQVEVASPCALDFGDRLLVIGGTLRCRTVAA